MTALSFQEYVQSKKRLKAALNETPFQICNYEATRYVKFETSTASVPIRPKNRFIVEWSHPKDGEPICERVILITTEGSQVLLPVVEGAKLLKWFDVNTKLIE